MKHNTYIRFSKSFAGGRIEGHNPSYDYNVSIRNRLNVSGILISTIDVILANSQAPVQLLKPAHSEDVYWH